MNLGQHIRSMLIILVVSIFTLFLHNGVIPANLMEARNLATAQEMVRTGHYLIPTMNGTLRLEKPPLPTWISAVVEKARPENLAAQRRVTALVTLLMAFVLYMMVFQFTGDERMALMSALVLVTSYNVIMNGRTATWDIYCHAFMLVAIALMLRGLELPGSQWRRFIWAGVWMGLSFMAKGPVAFFALLLPAVVSYAIVRRPRLEHKRLPLGGMVLLCLAVAGWWPLYIALSHADAGTSAMAQESAAWMNRHVRPFWYYWHFPDESGIWALCWVSSIIFYFKDNRPQFRRFNAFILLWNAVIWLLLSMVPEKKTRYLLPALIPGAVLVAFYFWHSMKALAGTWEKNLFRMNGWVVIGIAVLLPIGMFVLFVYPHAMGWGLFLGILVACWATAYYLFRGLYGWQGIRPHRLFIANVFIMTIFTATCFAPAGRLFLNEQRHSIRLLKQDPAVAALPFRHPQEEPVRMELVYEANHTILPIDLRDAAAVREALPFVLVSTDPADSLLQGMPVVIEPVGIYDNNWRKPDSHRYNPALVQRAAVIRAEE